MHTSELSDALNPYASQARQRQDIQEYSPQLHNVSYQPVVQPPQHHIPHVSELAMAMAQPAPPQSPARPRQGAQIIGELMRMVAATRQTQEEERQRRLAWEQEQEVKYAQRQEDMDKKVLEMLDEIKALRAAMNTHGTQALAHGLVTPETSTSPALSHHTATSLHSISPVLSVSQPASHTQLQPMFVQGSSTDLCPAAPRNSHYRDHSDTPQTTLQPHAEHTFQVNLQSAAYTITPDPSPLLTSAETSDHPSASQFTFRVPKPGKRKKKRSPALPSDDDSGSSTSSSASASRPRKRKNHHDTRCYTIQHAMRIHILRMMNIENDKELPNSHQESTSLAPGEAIRFVWNKTTKQSVHNGRMKKRVIDDIQENRELYKHVSSKDFGKKQLDAAFEQCFVTLRQKYKVQRDGASAMNYKQREEQKARKARHLSRRKFKLSNRSDARNSLPAFEAVTFDGALQHDCMSSDESDLEMDPETSQTIPILRARGFSWRSTRLQRFYNIMDDEDRLDASTKQKRGVGRKERRVGRVKEEFILPPEGVATWMISKRWIKASLAAIPDLPGILSKLIVDPPGFDWLNFHELGAESADEEDVSQVQQQQPPSVQFERASRQQMFNVHMQNMDMSLSQQPYPTPGSYNFAM